MIDAIDLAAAKEAKLVRNIGQVGPILRNVRPALATLFEWKWTLHEVSLAALHGGFHLAFSNELLEM